MAPQYNNGTGGTNKKERNNLLAQIASISFSSNSLIVLTSNLEWSEDSNGGYKSFVKDTVFLEVSPKKDNNTFGYNKEKSISMLLDINDMRALAYACKEIVKLPIGQDGKVAGSSYEKITNSGKMKKLFVGGSLNNEKMSYFINVREGSTVGVSFSKYDLLAFSDSIIALACESEKYLFRYRNRVAQSIQNAKIAS